MRDLQILSVGVFAVFALSACGAADNRPVAEGGMGTVRMPLVAESTAGNTYRLDPAKFKVTGGTVNKVVDGSGVDVLNVDLAPGDYLMQLQTGWQLNLVAGGMTTPVASVLQSANPQGFNIQDQQISDIVFRFGVGPDAIAFGLGRGRVSIEVNDGCGLSWFRDADGDGFGGSETQQACAQPPGFVADGTD